MKNPQAIERSRKCLDALIQSQDIDFMLPGIVESQKYSDQRGAVVINELLLRLLTKIR